MNGAKEWYSKANDPPNAFAQLSLALSEVEKSEERSEAFRKGLAMLEEPSQGPLGRLDVSGRTTALAWAVIAASEVGDRDKTKRYLDELRSSKIQVHAVGHFEPLFSCPSLKAFASLEEIIGNIETTKRII